MPGNAPTPRNPHRFRYLLIDFFTVAPLWATWLVFDFLLGMLSSTGAPFLKALAGLLRPLSDTLASWLLNSDGQYAEGREAGAARGRTACRNRQQP